MVADFLMINHQLLFAFNRKIFIQFQFLGDKGDDVAMDQISDGFHVFGNRHHSHGLPDYLFIDILLQNAIQIIIDFFIQEIDFFFAHIDPFKEGQFREGFILFWNFAPEKGRLIFFTDFAGNEPFIGDKWNDNRPQHAFK